MTLLIATKTDNSVILTADTRESLLNRDGTILISSNSKRKIFAIHTTIIIGVSGMGTEYATSLIRNILMAKNQITKADAYNCCKDVLDSQLSLYKKFNPDDTRGVSKALICGLDPESNAPFIITYDQRPRFPETTEGGWCDFAGTNDDDARKNYREKFIFPSVPSEVEIINAATSTIAEMSLQSQMINATSLTVMIKDGKAFQYYFDGQHLQQFSDRYLDRKIDGEIYR